MTQTVANAIIADMAAKIGLRAVFVSEYLADKGYSALDLSRSVVGAAVAGQLVAVNEAIFLNDVLPSFQ